ncbi:MAG: type VI secretion system tip protein TssI/VgrG, partial [Myxococcota bacterium]
MGDENVIDVLCSFECDGSSVKWDVQEAGIRDALNMPVVASLNLTTVDVDADPGELLGRSCTIEFERGEDIVFYSGIVSGIDDGVVLEGKVSAMVDVTAAVGLLAQGRQTRVFQNLTVPEILAEVLESRLADFDRKVEQRLDRQYPVCEYRLQYDESNLDFCQRLMEEEGIAYWFEQNGAAELMVLADDPAAYPEIEGDDGALVAFDSTTSVTGRAVVRRIEQHRALRPTKLSLRHYDWTRPTLCIEEEQEGDDSGDDVDGAALGPVREDFQHDRVPPTLSDYDPDKKAFMAEDAKVQATIRRECQERDKTTLDGASGVTRFAPGRVFELMKHPHDHLNAKYLLTSVTVSFTAGVTGGGTYSNGFRAIPAETPYRPTRQTPKPTVRGIETATVVGPSKQEIFTDEHGRVKIQFHWDREGQND